MDINPEPAEQHVLNPGGAPFSVSDVDIFDPADLDNLLVDLGGGMLVPLREVLEADEVGGGAA